MEKSCCIVVKNATYSPKIHLILLKGILNRYIAGFKLVREMGQKTNIRVVNNKVAPPFKTTMIEMIPGVGLDNVGAIIALSVKQDSVKNLVLGTIMATRKHRGYLAFGSYLSISLNYWKQ